MPKKLSSSAEVPAPLLTFGVVLSAKPVNSQTITDTTDGLKPKAAPT